MALRRLLIVDGTGHLYRSYFAIKVLSAHDGTPTNAVFGFIRTLHQLKQIWRPTHLLVAWDGGTPQARLDLLPTYKAQRPPMPDPLRSQIAPIFDYLERAAIPLVRREREEADDVIASLTAWARRDGADEVLIASSDKDLFQIVDERVSIIGASKDDPRMGADAIHDKTGVWPAQIVDWLALAGDSADNIPGVEGIGAKTAARLIGQFGSLDALWPRLAEVEPERIRTRLSEARARVETNVRLVRLLSDLDCSPGWAAMATAPEVPGRLKAFYERMEFHSFLKGMEQPDLL
jgi:DNA polymerase-1